MTLNTVRRTFLVGAPLAFAALLTLHPMGTGDMFDAVSENVTRWLIVHYGGAIGFPAMALVIWLLIRDLPGRAATSRAVALPVYAVFYGVWEALFGIATGIMPAPATASSGAERDGAEAAFNAIISSPLVGEPGVFVSIGRSPGGRDLGRDHRAQARRCPPRRARAPRHRRPDGVPRPGRPARARLPQHRRVHDRAPPRGGGGMRPVFRIALAVDRRPRRRRQLRAAAAGHVRRPITSSAGWPCSRRWCSRRGPIRACAEAGAARWRCSSACSGSSRAPRPCIPTQVGASGDDYTGLLAIPAGLALLGLGATTLWSTRRTRRQPPVALPAPRRCSARRAPPSTLFVVAPLSGGYLTPISGARTCRRPISVPATSRCR